MGKNNTKAEKAKRNLAYAMAHKKRAKPVRRFGRPAPSPAAPAAVGSAPVGDRPMFPAVCSTCGQETTVPFEPTTGKPVQCRSCFQPKPRP